nr:hypothetical protein [Kibdelosporangium sp. MJ126-NF4]CTQ90137.1 hypothetical protein [Kibdelosporangium sp. MJ126-NF4]
MTPLKQPSTALRRPYDRDRPSRKELRCLRRLAEARHRSAQ